MYLLPLCNIYPMNLKQSWNILLLGITSSIFLTGYIIVWVVLITTQWKILWICNNIFAFKKTHTLVKSSMYLLNNMRHPISRRSPMLQKSSLVPVHFPFISSLLIFFYVEFWPSSCGFVFQFFDSKYSPCMGMGPMGMYSPWVCKISARSLKSKRPHVFEKSQFKYIYGSVWFRSCKFATNYIDNPNNIFFFEKYSPNVLLSTACLQMDELLTPSLSWLQKCSHLSQPDHGSGLQTEVKCEEDVVCWRDRWLHLVIGKAQRKQEKEGKRGEINKIKEKETTSPVLQVYNLA